MFVKLREKMAAARGKFTPKKGLKLLAVLLVLGVGAGVGLKMLRPQAVAAGAQYTDETVSRRDVSVVLTGSGTIEPVNQYSITSLVSGEVLACTFEEGDTVEKDDLLYTIDTKDAENSVEKAQLNVEKARMNYDETLETLANLNVKSETEGVVTEVYVEPGDEIQSGTKIADVRDSAYMVVKLPFNAADAENFYIGQSALVTVDGSFETLTGEVSAISATDEVGEGYQLTRTVTIRVKNPGGLSSTAYATVTVGGAACNTGASFEYNAESTITAKASGEVASLSITEGSAVSKGSVVARLTSTSIENQVKSSQISLQDAELSLQNTLDQLDNYNITAPISGTVITKNAKLGDTVDTGASSSTLAVIYDMSQLVFDMAIDELDISSVAVGQTVEITADAIEGTTFTGVVDKVSVSGTSQNGVTSYPVTVVIDGEAAGGLLPGMNVTASIVVESAENALSVPVGAVMRGNIVYVKDDGAAQDAAQSGEGDEAPGAAHAPDGYRAVEVTLGVSNDDYIEILSGLSEGDVVGVPAAARQSTSGAAEAGAGMGMMGMGGGGMPSGGGPGGGGGMPGGMR